MHEIFEKVIISYVIIKTNCYCRYMNKVSLRLGNIVNLYKYNACSYLVCLLIYQKFVINKSNYFCRLTNKISLFKLENFFSLYKYIVYLYACLFIYISIVYVNKAN